jgi:hypothetical protein
MKKSEFSRNLSESIDLMFNRVSDETLIGEMFSGSKAKIFSRSDFVSFLKSPFLIKFKGLWKGLYAQDGKPMDQEAFFLDAAQSLLDHFNQKKMTKDKKFADCFNYKKGLTEPGYFDEISEVITNCLVKHGSPPLFHKTQDKILRYAWEKESDG